MLGGRVDLHERFRRYRYAAMVSGASLVCAAGLALSIAYAQVTVTTTVTGNGLGTTVTPTANGVAITGGGRGGPTRSGPNLFHSFGFFNVGTGDTANFVNDSGLPTTNIIGRVTDARSDIFGTVKTTAFGAANLWLVNPKGFVFGPGATLDVGGSFHASTADYIKFSDENIFYADLTRTSALSVAPPSAFGFLSAPTGRIDVLAGTVDQTTRPPTINSLLKVPEGKTVSLVGGTVNVGGQVDLNNNGTPDVSGRGYILAPSGHVNLVSVASSGEATFDPTTINGSTGGPVTGVPSTRDINVSGFAQLGNINITRGSIVDGKEVSVSGGQLVIDTAAVYPGSFWLYRNLGALTVSGISTLRAPNGGLVNVNIAGDVSIRGDTQVPVINDLSGILTVAGFPFARVTGDVPNIRLNARSLTLSGEKASIQAVRFGPDKAADVSITAADSVRIEKGASIEAINFFQGPGGSLSVNTGDLVIDGGGSLDFTGLRAQGRFHPGYGVFSRDPIVYSAESGTITVNASNNVTLLNSGIISANSFTFGNGGGVTVNAKNLSLDNRSLIIAESTLGGSAGNVEINASGQVNLTNNSQISSTTTGSGTGGNVVVTAGQPTTVSGSSGIFASTVPPNQMLLDFFASNFTGPPLRLPTSNPYAALQGIVSMVSGIPNPSIFDVLRVLRDNFRLLQFPDSALIPGNGGAISITTPLLTVNSGAAVSSSTSWDGNAGQVLANVGSLIVASGGEIRSRTGLVDATGTSLVGRGNAGELRIDATDTITVTGGSISTTTIGNGTAGNISLSANEVNVQNGSSVTSASGQTVNGKLIVGTGNAGTVKMTGTDISVSGTGSTVSTSTLGNGNGGNVSLTAGRSVNIVNGGLVNADSLGGTGLAGNIEITAGDQIAMTDGSVSTRAVTSDGGNITLNAPRMIQLVDSQVTTSVESGFGGGGNISIDPQGLILNNSKILANAFGGPGGNINIAADVFLVNSGGQFPTSLTGIVDASSALSTPGTVNIEATFTNVVGTFTQLPSTPLQASELLRASCAARFSGGKASSLVVGGRDGLPLQPGDLLPSPLSVDLATAADTPSTGDNKVTSKELSTRFSLLGPQDRLLNRYSLLPNAKCSL